MSSSRRLEKINELIHRFLSGLLRKELDVEAMVTVSEVITSGNVQNSTVRISVYPFEKSKSVLREIEKNIYEIQQKLNRGLRMRPVPKIKFELDESEEKGSRILEALGGIEK